MYDLPRWMSDYCSMILSVLVPALSGGLSCSFPVVSVLLVLLNRATDRFLFLGSGI